MILLSQGVADRGLATVLSVHVRMVALLLGALAWAGTALADGRTAGERLVKAYPDHIERVDGNELVWRDGSRMPIDDGAGEKPFAQWLKDPDIEDMFRFSYGAGEMGSPPARNFDPGRARNGAFFDKLYGDCRKGEVSANLVDVVWLASKSGRRFKATKINGVASQLQKISNDLDRLADIFTVFLEPPAGTFNCRVIAGTQRLSAHSYGAAIDISVKRADYWRWALPAKRKSGEESEIVYRNAIPIEIVEIFERHGFIWGGRWYHYDTMHFEYRPELLLRGY